MPTFQIKIHTLTRPAGGRAEIHAFAFSLEISPKRLLSPVSILDLVTADWATSNNRVIDKLPSTAWEALKAKMKSTDVNAERYLASKDAWHLTVFVIEACKAQSKYQLALEISTHLSPKLT